MNPINILLLLIYGFAMITMGMFALNQKDRKQVNVSIIRSLKYLGLFGITHGLSEWITMIIQLKLFPAYELHINNFNLILKAASFALLLYFGLDILLLRDRYKRFILKIPAIAFILFLVGYFYLRINYGLDYNLNNPVYTTITMRYMLGFFSCHITAIGLYKNAALIRKKKSEEIAKRYTKLSWVFIVYGVLEGLVVSKADFFPANVINRDTFVEVFSFSPLFIKAFVGFVIYYLLIKVIDTFSWEQEEAMKRLEQQRIANEERRKLGLELHDSIIQDLYATGLKLDYLSKNCKSNQLDNPEQTECQRLMREIKQDLNSNIEKIREFISATALNKIEMDELHSSLDRLIKQCNQNPGIKIDLLFKNSPYTGYLSPETSTQVYYIVQEAVCNILKHSEADKAEVFVEGQHDNLYITVTDNGKGISIDSLNKERHFGLLSMQERTDRIGGQLSIQQNLKGTRIELKVPWEGEDNER